MLNPATSQTQFFFQTTSGPSANFAVQPGTTLDWSVTGTFSTGTWQLEQSIHANFWQVIASGSAAAGGTHQVPAANAPVNYRINVLTLPATHRVTCVIAASNLPNLTSEVRSDWQIARRMRHALIRELIIAAEFNNPVNATPWSAAPPWTINTPYLRGSTVRNGPNNNVYICASPGTSAASGGPLADTFDGIVDNTCTWMYLEQSRAQTVFPLYSTVVPAGPADRMNGFTTAIPTSSLAALGLTNQYNSTVTDRVAEYFGGPLVFDGGNATISGPNFTLPGNVGDTTWGRGGIHFMTDCKRHLFLWPTAHTRDRFHIEINGRPLTDGNYSHSAAVANGGTLLNMSAFGSDVKDVKIYASGLLPSIARSFAIAPTEAIWKPVSKSDVVLCFEGDHIIQGGGLGDLIISRQVEQLTAKLLGIERYYNNAVGPTGLLNNFMNLLTLYIERLNAIFHMNPDILVLGSFINDVPSSFPDRLLFRSRLVTYLRMARAALPNCTIVVCGSSPLFGQNIAPGGELFNHELDKQIAFNAWGDSNAIFVPMVGRAAPDRPIVPNTANGWYYLSGGSAPFNDTSPTIRFYPVLATIIASAIRNFFLRLPPV